MKIAIISDIHSNLEALRSVLADIKSLGYPVQIVCLGDVVGYGPDPNACIQLTKENAVFTLAGNHDQAVLGMTDVTNFNSASREVITWTIGKISQEGKTFLKSLSLLKIYKNSTFVHASPNNPADWNYIITLNSAKRCFDFFETPFCFIGHTHAPIVFVMSSDGSVSIVGDKEVKINPEREKALVNVGSVGQPRDNNAMACYVVFDPNKHTVLYRRVQYNINEVAAKMAEFNLPSWLYERLYMGR